MRALVDTQARLIAVGGIKVAYYSYPKKKYQNFEICEIKAIIHVFMSKCEVFVIVISYT